MDLTILEINLAEPSFNANAPFSGDDAEADFESEAAETAGDSGRRIPSAVGFLVGLVFLVGVAVAVRRFRRDDSPAIEAESESEPIPA
jgi:hypothetical protein